MKEVEKPRPRTLKLRFMGGLIALLARMLCATLRLKIEREAETEALLADGGILVTWHGRTMIPVTHFYGRARYFMLISLSRDGDAMAEIIGAMGCSTVRGSTGRRGVAATRELLKKLSEGGILAFTPDGPRGPTRVVQPGVVYFAQRSGKPIIAVGVSAWPRWQLGAWDRYLIPKPFAKARWIYGEPIYVGPEDDLAEASLRVGKAIARLESEAEEAVRAK